MSGAPRRGAPLRAAVGRARAGIVAIGRGAVLAALALAALIPLAALLVLALTPLWGSWTAITLDGQGRRRLPAGMLPQAGFFYPPDSRSNRDRLRKYHHRNPGLQYPQL